MVGEACDRGSALACARLGMWLYERHLVTRDVVELDLAARCFQESCRLGYRSACVMAKNVNVGAHPKPML